MNIEKHDRRKFLLRLARAVACTCIGAASPGSVLANRQAPAKGEMPYQTLGRSEEKVSLLGLGGWHLGILRDEKESTRFVRTPIDNGVNFMDNCRDYHWGLGEERMGKAFLDGYRRRVFLMTKIDGQVKPAAENSLRNHCAGSGLRLSTWCSFMKSSAWETPTGSSAPMARSKR